MFIGEYKASLDGKSRVIIPAKLRDELGSRFVLAQGLDRCLSIYTPASWDKLTDDLITLSGASKDARAYKRYFAARSVDCELDSQGRVTIPQNLRDYAGLERDLIINGMLTSIEIWDRTTYIEAETNNVDIDVIAEKMAELGL